MPTVYSGHWLLPIDTAPIEHGAVAVQGSTILAVGSLQEISTKYPDSRIDNFGEAAILPGLVNAHSHLELTVMRGFLEAEETNFFAWLKKLTLGRMAMTPEDLLVSATCGAIEATRAGITCMGDSSSFAVDSMKALTDVGLRGIVYQESFGPDPNLAKDNVNRLADQLLQLREYETAIVRAGVSPHAPYTVSPPQLELISRLAIDRDLPLMMHAAESQAERLLLLQGAGPFAEGLQNRGIEWQAPGISTIEHLKRHGILEVRPLLAHCVNVDEADIELIKASHASVAHCPKSNAKLRHGRAPFAGIIEHEIRVGLGSDSMASNNNCDILEEARFATLLARLTDESNITAEQALFAATLGGARALGLDDEIGALKEGLAADLTVIGLGGVHQQPYQDPVAALVFASSGRDVLATIVGGKEIYRDGEVKGVPESELRSSLKDLRKRIEAATVS
jgi:cytosine/adenosine deaminase-related metal-dependent hydrolase